jgi:hypothetical protein
MTSQILVAENSLRLSFNSSTRPAPPTDGYPGVAALLAAVTVLLSSCASRQPEHTDQFFLPQKQVASHGRKSLLDHLVEVDPGRNKFKASEEFKAHPPEEIAVLPFRDRNQGDYLIDKISLSPRNGEEGRQWAWTYAQRLRRRVTGYLAQREFVVDNLLAVDTVLADRGVDSWQKLIAVPPRELGRWLGADAVVYGEVLHYEAFYAFLVASWQVEVRIRMVSTRDGHELFAADDNRYAVDLRPSLDPIDMAINSAFALLQLRDVTLARAEEEVSREVVLRIPVCQQNIARLKQLAREREYQVMNDPPSDSPPIKLTNFAGKSGRYGAPALMR